MKVDERMFLSRARAAAESAALEMQAVHGAFWAGRGDLTKLVLTLSSAMLAGTISFAEKILGPSLSPCIAWLQIGCWSMFFGSICAGLASLWHTNTLLSFRARFASSELVAKLRVDTTEELVEDVLGVVNKYSNAALEPLEAADQSSQIYARISIFLFVGALAVFIVIGGLLVKQLANK